MIRRPPRSPLFPTRRSSDLGRHRRLLEGGLPWQRREHQRGRRDPVGRSEEHTSELQSQSNLVCRLLFLNDPATTEISPLSYTTLFRSRTSPSPPGRWASLAAPRTSAWSPRSCR